MDDYDQIFIPRSADDQEGAYRSFKEFSRNYSELLHEVSNYLDTTLEDVAPAIAAAYKPWQVALNDLMQGSIALAHKLKPKNPEAFFEALQIFSLESAVQFIRDLCLSCKMKIEQEWSKNFQEQVNTLLFAYSIITRRQAEQSIIR